MCDCKPQKKDEVSYDDVKEYYGKRLKQSEDLGTDVAVCRPASAPAHVRDALSIVHDEVAMRYFGCGLVIPEHVEGAKILDLGSGSGRDCFAIAKLVGEKGHVTGLDMTQEQLDIANKYVDYHWKKCGFSGPNVDFVFGYMEKLEEAGIKKDFYDIIISNCVLNLSPDKPSVLREAYKVLKDGGEIYFSDIYSDQVVPDHIRQDKVLYGECLGGALWWEDLIRIAEECGFARPQLTKAHIFQTKSPEINRVVADINFVSATYRIFKLPKTEDFKPCKATYLGNMIGFPESFSLNAKLTFQKGQQVVVDSSVAAILKSSRFANCFNMEPLSCCDNKDVVSPCPVNPFTFAAEKVNTECCAGKGSDICQCIECTQLACPEKSNVASCCSK